MAKAKRVHNLAKELGVESKAILQKCQDEGLEMKNHMATVSVGLEMTIREWFSEEHAGGTAVETAQKVDLAKVRKAKPRKKAKPPQDTVEAPAQAVEAGEPPFEPAEASEPQTQAQPVTQAEGEAEAQAQVQATSAPAKARRRKVEPKAPAEPEAPAAPQEPSPDEPAAEQGPQAPAEPAEPPPAEPDTAPPRAVPNVPRRPEKVGPVGPQLQRPQQAQLKGPKVVRVERAEEVAPPRPRRSGPSGPPSDAPVPARGPVRGRGAGGGFEDDSTSRSPRRRRGGGGGGGGGTGGVGTGGAGRSSGGRSREQGDAEVWRRGTVSEQDLIEREERLNRAGGFVRRRQRDMKKRATTGGPALSPAEVGGKVEIAEPFTIKELSATTGIKAADIVKYLFSKGVMTTVNHAIGPELAQEVCLEYDIELVVKQARSAEQAVEQELVDREEVDVRRRPPVVAVLGHVDHGKTSLLDKIRKADVVSGEAGGITQHIGAYRATIPGSDGEDKTVVFLDTPGHEAFTSMRARGANLTDVVVLVVAADDGLMPQTLESINHAKAAGVPIVVALNKIDVPQATDSNIQRILGQLAEHELNPVEWGGQTEVIRTSAETGQGVTDLMEILDYQAELLELTADYGGTAYGQVIEAELSEGRGPVARVLVRGGQLKIGDFIVMGRAFGRVRDMIDDRGNNIEIAGPATPVEISGIDHVPDAGDKFYVTSTLKQAEQIATTRREEERKRELASKTKVSLENVFEQMQAGDVRELRVVIKADVQGSVEVLRKTIAEVGQDNQAVTVNVLHAAVGGITESDVLLAEASNAVIVGFDVIASQRARAEAERRNVDIRLYRVIYDIVEDVKNALEGMLAPERREQVLGHAEVREVFRVSKVGAVAGCYVTDGIVQRNALIRVTRDDIVIEHDRVLSSLKRFKEDAREVRGGTECGMSIDGYNDIQVGDILECYTTSEVKATL